MSKINRKKTAMILLVDDQPANLKVLSSFLNGQDFDVRIHESGERALAMLQHTLPDIILLDVMMPGIDGFSICSRIKANPQTADIPVIFLTALDDIEDKVTGFAAGGADYITKPFQKVEVLSRLRTHLSLHRKQIALDQALAELQNQNETLEQRIAERTLDLRKNCDQLEKSRQETEKKNIALKVLLDQYQATQKDLERQVTARLKKMVYPYLDLLQQDVSSVLKDEYVALIREYLDSTVNSFSKSLSDPSWHLTPREILVADLIKQGKNTREIAGLLNISPRTAETYRNAIRKKVGLSHKKTSLRAYLSDNLIRI